LTTAQKMAKGRTGNPTPDGRRQERVQKAEEGRGVRNREKLRKKGR